MIGDDCKDWHCILFNYLYYSMMSKKNGIIWKKRIFVVYSFTLVYCVYTNRWYLLFKIKWYLTLKKFVTFGVTIYLCYDCFNCSQRSSPVVGKWRSVQAASGTGWKDTVHTWGAGWGKKSVPTNENSESGIAPPNREFKGLLVDYSNQELPDNISVWKREYSPGGLPGLPLARSTIINEKTWSVKWESPIPELFCGRVF